MFSIAPLEVASSLPLALKIRRGTGNEAWLWLEYRRPIGDYDSHFTGVCLPDGTCVPSPVYSGALIHYEDSPTDGRTHLLDYTPATDSWLDPQLAAGQSWTDPHSNVSLTVQSATSTALTVAVNYGAVPCTRANPSIAVSPPNPSAPAGGTVSYTLTVVNKDSAACPGSLFNFVSTAPSGWQTAFVPESIALDPGQSASAVLTKTIPAGTPSATYTVDASASDGNRTSATSATATVTAPATPKSSSVTGMPDRLLPTTARPTRARRSFNPVVRARIAINSLATVMS